MLGALKNNGAEPQAEKEQLRGEEFRQTDDILADFWGMLKQNPGRCTRVIPQIAANGDSCCGPVNPPPRAAESSAAPDAGSVF